MINKVGNVICFFYLLVAIFPIHSLRAQSQYDEGETQPQYSLADQTKSDMMVIVAAGLGGAVLGLSTLSFANQPSQHTDNILTGAAIGIIIGVVYVAYQQAYGPSSVISTTPSAFLPLVKGSRVADTNLDSRSALQNDLYTFHYHWSF